MANLSCRPESPAERPQAHIAHQSIEPDQRLYTGVRSWGRGPGVGNRWPTRATYGPHPQCTDSTNDAAPLITNKVISTLTNKVRVWAGVVLIGTC